MRMFLLATAIMITGPMLAQAPTVVVTAKPAVVADAGPTSGPNRIICRHEDPVGSRLMGRKLCMKAIEWESRH